jgi:hypothetical protein
VNPLNRCILVGTMLGFGLVPSLAYAQAQPIQATAGLVPFDITIKFMLPAYAVGSERSRNQLLIARHPQTAPIAIGAIEPLAPTVCLTDLRCP